MILSPMKSPAISLTGTNLAMALLICAICSVTGCRLLLTEAYVTKYRVEDTELNRLAAKECLERVASHVNFRAWTDDFTNQIAGYGSHEGQIEAWPEKADFTIFRNDIIDLESLAFRLKQPSPTDLVSEYFRMELSTNTLTLLSNYTGGTNPLLLKTLRDDLSHVMILKGPLYNVERFANIKLSSRTSKMLAQKLSGLQLNQLNRLLFEDAYPGTIRPMKNDSIMITFKMYTHRKTKRYLEIEKRATQEVQASFGDNYEMTSGSYLVP
jgi:hypothetical protein